MGPSYEQKAVHAFELNLRRKEEEMINDKELGECLLYLSRYYKKVGEIDKAIDLARRLSDLQGVEKDEANKLLQELNLLS
jgi:lipopolysaccharide biosynthesis regulator YciM